MLVIHLDHLTYFVSDNVSNTGCFGRLFNVGKLVSIITIYIIYTAQVNDQIFSLYFILLHFGRGRKQSFAFPSFPSSPQSRRVFQGVPSVDIKWEVWLLLNL
jgi:hypothetical protein